MGNLTINDDPRMGLNNTICLNPSALCLSKRVLLSADDIKEKSCAKKMDGRMLEAKRCNWLKDL